MCILTLCALPPHGRYGPAGAEGVSKAGGTIPSNQILVRSLTRLSIVPSVSRFAVGAACGLYLVLCFAVPTLLFSESFLAEPNQLSTESQGSILNRPGFAGGSNS